MANVNERPQKVGLSPEDALLTGPVPHDARPSAPIWQLRSHLRTPAVVRTIGTRIAQVLRPSTKTQKPTASSQPRPTDDLAPTELARRSIGDDDRAAAVFVAEQQARGMEAEALLLDLLAPAARHLGELWASDAADFALVTLGMNRLHRILRELAEELVAPPDSAATTSVLLTVVPGEQHSFGLAMVAEFFRRAGWNLCMGPFSTHGELINLVGNHWFDVVGFSVSSDRRLDELKTDIDDIRRRSRNRHVVVLIGGPMVLTHPELLTEIGADGLSTDALTAPQQARSLVGRMASRH